VRIELGEIEAALRSHPQVGEAVAALWHGHGEAPRLVAYVVGREAELSGAAVRAWLAQRVPRGLVPETVMAVERLPRTSSGKVDRRALPVPGRADAAAATTFVAARTPTETLLAALWRDVLAVERIGTTDNFFEAGGHSLKAMQLAVRIQAAFGVDVSAQGVFETPTVAALAKTIEQLVTDDIVRLHRDEPPRLRTE
jgi:acyl carrier protein